MEKRSKRKKTEKKKKSLSSTHLLRLDLPRGVRRHPDQDQQARPRKPPERGQPRQLLHRGGRRRQRAQEGRTQDRHAVERARDVLRRRPPGAHGRDACALLLELLGEVGRVELEEGVVVVEEDDQGDGGLLKRFGFRFFFFRG